MINILILNWNSSEDVRNLLKTLCVQTYTEFRVILIHNGSPDFQQVKNIFDHFRFKLDIYFVNNEGNFGYAGGNNSGLAFLEKKCFSGDILIINPDVTLSPNTLEVMLEDKEKESNVIGVMVRTFALNGNIIYDSIELKGLNHVYHKTSQPLIETDYLAGSCMLLDRDIVDTVGLFDEKFFMYFEEVDLSLRMKKKGGRLVSTTRTHVTRKDNHISRSYNAVYFSCRNAIYLYQKHDSIRFINVVSYLLRQFLWSVNKGINNGDWIYLKKVFAGIRDRWS